MMRPNFFAKIWGESEAELLAAGRRRKVVNGFNEYQRGDRMVRSFANEQAKSERDDDARVRRFDRQES
jgi:hypothetical protein